jgi:hypothetical protein
MGSTLRALREFFLWLSGQPGFRSRISFGDTAYFRLSEKDDRVAQVSVEPPFRRSTRSNWFWAACQPTPPCSAATEL